MSLNWLYRFAAPVLAVALGSVVTLAHPVASLAAPAAPVLHAAKPVKHGNAAFGIQAATRGRPDGRATLSYSATPGAGLEDHIAIENLGTRPLTLRLYATDATSAQDGSFALIPSSARPADVGTWISTEGVTTVRVPARTSRGPSYKIVAFRLAVPKDASPGDHAGGIVVSLQGVARNKQGVKVRLDQRVAMRVYARVSGTVVPKLSVDSVHVSFAGPAIVGNPFGRGVLRVRYRVRNTGNVLLGGTQAITVTSTLGATRVLANYPVMPPLLPGASIRVERRISGVFPGLSIDATVRLTPVVPAGSPDPPVNPVAASASVWAWPWALLLWVGLLVAVTVVVAMRRARHRRGSFAPPSHPTLSKVKAGA